MVTLTRLNGKPIMVNALLIETIEETPDTMITLVTGKKIMVLEPVPEVVAWYSAFFADRRSHRRNDKEPEFGGVVSCLKVKFLSWS